MEERRVLTCRAMVKPTGFRKRVVITDSSRKDAPHSWGLSTGARARTARGSDCGTTPNPLFHRGSQPSGTAAAGAGADCPPRARPAAHWGDFPGAPAAWGPSSPAAPRSPWGAPSPSGQSSEDAALQCLSHCPSWARFLREEVA